MVFWVEVVAFCWCTVCDCYALMFLLFEFDFECACGMGGLYFGFGVCVVCLPWLWNCALYVAFFVELGVVL